MEGTATFVPIFNCLTTGIVQPAPDLGKKFGSGKGYGNIKSKSAHCSNYTYSTDLLYSVQCTYTYITVFEKKNGIGSLKPYQIHIKLRKCEVESEPRSGSSH